MEKKKLTDVCKIYSDNGESITAWFSISGTPIDMEIPKRWLKTEALQWVRRVNDVNDGYFELIEVRCLTPDTFQVVTGTIDITDYTEKELNESVNTHYENLERVKESYPDNWKQIVAECVFENSADYELVSFGPYTSEDEAERYVLDNLIKKA